MDVPLFPAPPTIGGVVTPVSDVVDVANLTPVPLSAIACTREQHVGTKPSRTIGIHKIRHSTRRNLVYPKLKDQIEGSHHAIEFRIRMTEEQTNDVNEDDDDVVYAIGMINFCWS